MELSGLETLVDCMRRHAESRKQIEAWCAEVRDATWITSADIKNRYPNASILKGNIYIFDIKGKKYRIATAVNFRKGYVFVKWAGTHAEYNKRKIQNRWK